ncbi:MULTISPECIES: DUF6530 family protein [unclassified Clostridioides]|uniref:DUF6530 family protein n=1 Tax=unclassified Clostridioides TaxID=2635829 RepID=UPI001D112AFC|nr:hypothetical protein [Clostridioides sp. ES-S-0171-01]MCC0689180.1 hypothetical protein [Clostridioides sp. ES-S-0056-01]MCC0716850.1 hypothetical protein [Clostridioides sp. ES-S-0077-01]
MRVPEYLSHKPIVAVDNYDRIDGKYANNSDAKALSLGKAQWSDDENIEISAKVWRHTGGKWSRQSEELPLHRVLDLNILILSSMIIKKDNNLSKTNLDEVILNESDNKILEKFLDENQEYLKPRIRELKRILNEINLED